MPIKQTNYRAFIPLINLLKDHLDLKDCFNETSASIKKEFVYNLEPYHNTRFISLNKTAIFEDGRLDLCKSGITPSILREIMIVLSKNDIIDHLLLGNNLVGSAGIEHVINYLSKKSNIKTLYLAGNLIDNTVLKNLVEKVLLSNVYSLWLKRNPLGMNSWDDLSKLIILGNISTLDLTLTQLGDRGTEKLFEVINTSTTPIVLKNLYLDANGIGLNAIQNISEFIQDKRCKLESLYLSNNPLGDCSCLVLSKAIKRNTTLHRLTLDSCGINHSGCDAILESVTTHPNLIYVNIGQSYITADIHTVYNYITDESTDSIINLLRENRILKCLELGQVPMSLKNIIKIYEAFVNTNDSLIWIKIKSSLDNDPKVYQKEYLRLKSLKKLLNQKLKQNNYKTSRESNIKTTDTYIYKSDVEHTRNISSINRTSKLNLCRKDKIVLAKNWNLDEYKHFLSLIE